jgi:hypothetical protein
MAPRSFLLGRLGERKRAFHSMACLKRRNYRERPHDVRARIASWGLIDGSDFFAQKLSASLTQIQIPAGQEWREEGGALSPGGVSFHHQLVFHSSGANQTSQPRCGLAIHLRTEHSKISPDHHFAQYLNRPEICPTIYDNTVKPHFILSRLKSIAPRWMVARDGGDHIA